MQGEKTPNSGMTTVLTEPKYMLPDGNVFTDPWCRPQNDGPALRAKTLIGYATALQAEEKEAEKTTSKSNTTVGAMGTSSEMWPIVQIDLDWVAANWQTQGCDLWEEIRSDDFFWNR